MMMNAFKHRGRLLAGCALSVLIVSSAPVIAATPADTLVEAFAIDEIITMDPAESFELASGEIGANIYDLLVRFDLNDTAQVKGDLAESWTVSDDGLTYTFKLKPNLKFASGNALTAEDVAWSIERLIKLDKGPAFILAQFGLTRDNVTEKAKALDENTFVFTVDQAYAPSFVLNCLASSVGSVIDKKRLLEHVAAVTPTHDYPYETDFGNEWLKKQSAGSGHFVLRDWRANEIVVLDRNDNYWGEKAGVARVIYRHMKESATQRLSLEAGDIDVARNLEPGDLEALAKHPDITLQSTGKNTIFYIGLNQKNVNLAKPEVQQAFKYLIDYDAIGNSLLKGIGDIHQTFLPDGMLGQLKEKPYQYDPDKALKLLEEAGLQSGFSVTMDVRSEQPLTGIAEAIQQTFGKAGISIEILPGDNKQTLTKYRARNHDMYIGEWGGDYFDPNSNAQAFASNPDNGDEGKNKTLAWRNAWDIPNLTKQTEQALLERDHDKRAAMYRELQQTILQNSPFIVLYQQTEVAGIRNNVKGLKLGPSFDTNFVGSVTKE